MSSSSVDDVDSCEEYHTTERPMPLTLGRRLMALMVLRLPFGPRSRLRVAAQIKLWFVAGLPVRVAAHGSLDSEKEKTRAVVKVTDPGFPFRL